VGVISTAKEKYMSSTAVATSAKNKNNITMEVNEAAEELSTLRLDYWIVGSFFATQCCTSVTNGTT